MTEPGGIGILPQISIITSVFHGEKYLAGFFENVLAQTCISDCELILIHNEPTQSEIKIIEQFQKIFSHWFIHCIVKPVETLGCSWNRGIRASNGKYLAFWNVDDRRTSDSLEKQKQTLDADPSVALTYGDYIEVSDVGINEGWVYQAPEFERISFSRGMPARGAFLFLQNEIFQRCGLFDEQLTATPDMDFTVRAAIFGEKFKRTPSLLGFFTNQSMGLSTRDGGRLMEVETNVVLLRFGILEKIKWEYLRSANKYHANELLCDNQWLPFSTYPGQAKTSLVKTIWLMLGAAIRNIPRLLLKTMGVWDLSLRYRDRLLGRQKWVRLQ